MNISLDNPVFREVSCQQFLNYFAHIYRQEIEPIENVTRLVVKSDACNKFLFKCLENKHTAPISNDFVYTISSSRYFMFSKSETICLASIFLLNRLEANINKTVYRHDYIYNNKEALADIAIGIIKRCVELKTSVRDKNFYPKVLDFIVNKYLAEQEEYYRDQREFYESQGEEYDGDDSWMY